jgi:hypothetical protein
MDVYSIVVGAILLFPWSVVVLTVTGAILQRRRRLSASRPRAVAGLTRPHDRGNRSAGA